MTHKVIFCTKYSLGSTSIHNNTMIATQPEMAIQKPYLFYF